MKRTKKIIALLLCAGFVGAMVSCKSGNPAKANAHQKPPPKASTSFKGKHNL